MLTLGFWEKLANLFILTYSCYLVSGRFLIKLKNLGPTISRMSRWSWGSMLLTPMRSPIFKWIISPSDPMTIDPITIPGRPTHPSLSLPISGRWVWRSCANNIGFSQLHIRSRVKKGPTQPFPIWRVGSPYTWWFQTHLKNMLVKLDHFRNFWGEIFKYDWKNTTQCSMGTPLSSLTRPWKIPIFI